MKKTHFLSYIFFFGIIFFLFLIVLKYDDDEKLEDLSFDYENIEQYTFEDSLKIKSLTYIASNSHDKFSLGPEGRQYDLKNLPLSYIFESVDQSIDQSIKRISLNEYSTDQFVKYVLPYRLENETIEDWKQIGVERFKNCYDSDILKHSININEELKKIFQYTGDDRPNMAFSEMLENCEGGCFSMSKLATYAMRANGLPVAIDFAKWSNVGGRHQWNSLITNKYGEIPFLGVEINPNLENDVNCMTSGFKKFAKVYRKTFALNTDPKFSFSPKSLIASSNYIDVTDKYCDNVQNIRIVSPQINDGFLFYLCVYEKDNWVPIDYAHQKDGFIEFENVCAENIFILKKKESSNKIKLYQQPFILEASGDLSFLDANYKEKKDMNLKFFNSKENEYLKLLMKGTVKLENEDRVLSDSMTGLVKHNEKYKLYVWENNWKELTTNHAINDILDFSSIPSNGLYKLEGTNDEYRKLNRCFTYEMGKQHWW